MFKKQVFPILLALALVLSACSGTSVTLTPVIPTPVLPTDTQAAPPPATATFTVPPVPTVPAPTDTTAPTATSQAATATQPSNPGPILSGYIDDRSTASQVLVSYYNAINRREYLRAYSYYTTPSTTLGSYTAFQNGYTNTVSVDLVFGQITGDTSMSQTYFTVQVILKALTTNNIHTNYAACYIVHQASPGVFGAPPFQPMSIDRGQATTMAASASDASGLATSCNGLPSGPTNVSTGGTTLDISKSNFLDNRSGPIETVSSLLNAINLKQYVRAYYYFQDPTTFPGPYGSYAAGFSNTDTITVTFGTFLSEGAAGSLYFKVPLAEKVLTTTNTTQTFVGCYTLRLLEPTVQGVPPFNPMGIVSGKFTQVDNNADVNSLLPTACQ